MPPFKNFKLKFSPNPGKKLKIEAQGEEWLRLPIKTHFIKPGDNLEAILEKYVLSHCQKGDIIILGQKIVSIIQGRIIYKKDIKVTFWAKFLSKFVTKTPYGFSVGNPLKMQVAIKLAGLWRIVLAGIIGQIGKLFGIRGLFYIIAGHKINQLDGFYDEAFAQYSEIGILGPENCDELCQELEEKYKIAFAIGDINDLGGNILGKSPSLKNKEKLLLEILKDNPAGQSDQQTPIIIIRKINPTSF
jgi:hypothetical protein